MDLSNTRSSETSDERPDGQARQGQGYHQSWYPLSLSGELPSGAVIGKDFLGTRVILYRDSAGRAVVQSAYCPHLGADLSVGQVINGQIRCAYHHWTYGTDGKCVHIATGDKIPPGARIFTYPSAEAWGLVWAFNGAEPLFDVPRIPDADEADLIFETRQRYDQRIDPWMARSNGVDFQHFRALHGMPVADPDTMTVGPYSMEYCVDVAAERFMQHGLITGTNTFSLHLRAAGHDFFLMFTGASIRHGLSTYYYIAGIRKPVVETPEELRTTARRLRAAQRLVENLRVGDDAVQDTMRFRKGLLVASDQHIARFFKYVSKFPCAEPFEA
jgi:nitrite reductase/ring-hydroxylating ferredoxin subunit